MTRKKTAVKNSDHKVFKTNKKARVYIIKQKTSRQVLNEKKFYLQLAKHPLYLINKV